MEEKLEAWLFINENRWFNIGSRKEYLDVHRIIFEGAWKPAYVFEESWPLPVSPRAHVSSTAHLSGFYSIGPGAEIGDETVLHDTIVGENAKIASRSHLEGCIVGNSRSASGHLRNADH